jgi:hypothetical protein
LYPRPTVVDRTGVHHPQRVAVPDGQQFVAVRERGLRNGWQPDAPAQQRGQYLAGLVRSDELRRCERQHSSVHQPARQQQHVRSKALPADVAALPHLTRTHLRQRRRDRTPPQRAARIMLAVRADQIELGVVRLAGRPVERHLDQLGVIAVVPPPDGLPPVPRVHVGPAARRPGGSAARPPDRDDPHAGAVRARVEIARHRGIDA